MLGSKIMKKFFILLFCLFCFVKPIKAKDLSDMSLSNTDDLYQFLQEEKGATVKLMANSFIRGCQEGMYSLTNPDEMSEQQLNCLNKLTPQDIADQFSILYRKGTFKEITLSSVAIVFSILELCPPE